MHEPSNVRTPRFAAVACTCGLVLSAFCFDALAKADSTHDSGWVLQVSAFAQRDNALALKDKLDELGFEARIVTSGGAGEQRYRVITGHAASPEELHALRKSVEQQTGVLGYIRPEPMADADVNSDSDPVEELFAAPRSAYLLAQAVVVPPGGESIGSNPTHSYDRGLFRTPQETLDSNQGFAAAGLRIIPTLGLSLGHDDNITAAAQDEISSSFYIISPAIRVQLPLDHSLLAVTAAYDVTRYPDSSIDNRDSWYLRGDWAWDISTRQDLKLFAIYSEGADQRGEGRRQGDAGLIALDPDEWQRLGFGGLWDYGALGSHGRLTLQAGASDIEYTNNRGGVVPGTRGTAALDRDWWYSGATFYWRVAPKTSLLAEYLHSDISYQESVQSDSTEDSYLLGVTWDASARTSGTVKYGVQKKDFDDPTQASYDGPSWAATLSWRPRTYSVLKLSATRNTQEPDGNGDFVLRQDVWLSWLHDWNGSARIGTTIDLGYGEDDYRPGDRSDDLFFWGIAARYTFNHHLRFGASVRGTNRDSQEAQFNYDRRVYLLTLEVTY